MRWSVETQKRYGDSIFMLRRVPRMMGPDWDEMRMSMAPGWDEMQDPDCDKDWTDGSDWETVDEDDMETRTTSEKDRDETDDPDWETMDEDEMETSMTSETVKTGDPDRDTMDEEVQMDRGQEDFMAREDISLSKIMKTLFVITAMEKGKPRTIDVLALHPQGMRGRKTTYNRSPMEYKSRMRRALWESMKRLYRLREASILCTQAASTLFKVNVSQVKKGAPNRMFDSLKSRTDYVSTWRLWTEWSKKPMRRSCSGNLGLSGPKMRGKTKKRMETAGLVRPEPWWRRSESCLASPEPRWRRLRST